MKLQYFSQGDVTVLRERKGTTCEVCVKIMDLDLTYTSKAHILQNSEKIAKLLAQSKRNKGEF